MKVVLGSGSPRRRMILESFLDSIEIIVPDVDEKSSHDEDPVSYVYRILEAKLLYILPRIEVPDNSIIVVSDTIVTIDGMILGKPGSRDDAARMLRLLSGREHSVITGLALTVTENGKSLTLTSLDSTRVTFRDLNERQINMYLDSTEYADKAGSYAIQENGDMIIEKIEGSLTNVVGFPLRLFFSMLKDAGIQNKVLL